MVAIARATSLQVLGWSESNWLSRNSPVRSDRRTQIVHSPASPSSRRTSVRAPPFLMYWVRLRSRTLRSPSAVRTHASSAGSSSDVLASLAATGTDPLLSASKARLKRGESPLQTREPLLVTSGRRLDGQSQVGGSALPLRRSRGASSATPLSGDTPQRP